LHYILYGLNIEDPQEYPNSPRGSMETIKHFNGQDSDCNFISEIPNSFTHTVTVVWRNRFWRVDMYLLYTVGEILPGIIGILIALQ
jgi:hypothetical protein